MACQVRYTEQGSLYGAIIVSGIDLPVLIMQWQGAGGKWPIN